MRRGVSEDVSSCWPSGVSEESLRVRLDLVGQDDGQIQCLGDPCKLMQMCIKFLLALAKIFSTNVFAPEMRKH